MKNMKPNQQTTPEMLAEFDLAAKKGVRGKYYRAYREGHSVRVTKADGSVEIQYFTLQDGAVMLEPDVKAYFPDSEAVNQALRSLITLIPSLPDGRKSVHKNR